MGHKLLIVESPTKAKTISKYLGRDFTVLSSFGHIRDLPKSKMGVDVESNFEPTYTVPTKSKSHVTELKRAVKSADDVYLATDEDREGEAIAWHLAEALHLPVPSAKRITFHEITKDAIIESVSHPRTINMDVVNAQQTRRILDRLVGYELSPFLWKKVRYGLSAGRVQSVAMRLIVERERERRAFTIEEYWTIDAQFSKDTFSFPAKLEKIDHTKLDKMAVPNEARANEIVQALTGASAQVTTAEEKRVKKAPPTPFTTSTLQIDANTKLGMSAKQTMTLAQKLYETGHITYMRTDSLNLAEKFLTETEHYIQETFGNAYATGAKRYTTKSKGAQEAHEAIRPTAIHATPDSLKGTLEPRMVKLYELIWRRTLASQLPDAQLNRTVADMDVSAQGHTYTFRANGSTIVFDGFMKVYQSAKEKFLPPLKKGDAVITDSIVPTQHFTEPPARYSDATLVKAMEEFGIGRPSTYAPTISTIIDRGYIERDENKKLAPTEVAFIVNDLLVAHFHHIVDYTFTAEMESTLDRIAEGKEDWVQTLKSFYTPFHKNLEEKSKDLKREDVMPDRMIGNDPTTQLPIMVKSGRFGGYVQVGDYTAEDKEAGKPKPKSASLLKGMNIESLTLEQALECLKLPRLVGHMSNGEEIIGAIGRFGPYFKIGSSFVSLKEPYDIMTVDETTARTLITEALEQKKRMQTPLAEFGEDPTTHTPILLKEGRFGPYLTDGTTNASLGKRIAPQSLTREHAIEILEKKRAQPARAFRKPKSKKTS